MELPVKLPTPELLTPDLCLFGVEDITPEFLRSRGFSALIVDIDNTLVSRETGEITSAAFAWMSSLKQAGIAVCLLSNNWHEVVHDYAARLEVPLVSKALKPLPIAYIKALVTMGAHRATTAVVGDQVFTDILGARLCVIPCILVEPLSTTDLWYTRIFRLLEQKLTGQKPAAQKPGEQKLLEVKPAEQVSAEQKSAAQIPLEQKPAEQEPAVQGPAGQNREGF